MGRNIKLVDLVVDRYVNLDLFYRNQRIMPSGCTEWTGITSNIGYGFIGFKGVDATTGAPAKGQGGMMTTHRLAWMIANQRLPTLRNINHTCHNKLCVNPAHLTEGTQREKLDAMMRDGIKSGWPAGVARGAYDHQQHNRHYKYTIDDIQWVRTSSSDAIVDRYGMNMKRACAMRYAFRHGYRWLPCPAGMVKLKPGRKKKATK